MNQVIRGTQIVSPWISYTTVARQKYNFYLKKNPNNNSLVNMSESFCLFFNKKLHEYIKSYSQLLLRVVYIVNVNPCKIM